MLVLFFAIIFGFILVSLFIIDLFIEISQLRDDLYRIRESVKILNYDLTEHKVREYSK